MSGVRDLHRLRALLGGEAWRWWRERARKELEARRPLPATISLSAPAPAQREAANRLFGTPEAAGPIRVRTAEIESLLREAGIADDLPCALIALDGPVSDRIAEEESSTLEWVRVHLALRGTLARFAVPEALETLATTGQLRRFSAHQPADAHMLIRQAATVLEHLDRVTRPVHLAVLSARAIGDAHALDRDRVLGRLVLRLRGLTQDDGVLAWRAAWNRLGVLVDAVSASTLTLNLSAGLETRLGRMLHAMDGEPVRLTARQLELEAVRFDVRGRTIFICENPTVIAAAAGALCKRCPPMMCVDGRATSPSLMLLSFLERDGALLRYQGDADWPGLAIQADLRRHVRLNAWRLTASDLGQFHNRPGIPLDGDAVATPWEPGLAPALADRGAALHEETILDVLLADLATAATL